MVSRFILLPLGVPEAPLRTEKRAMNRRCFVVWRE